MIVCPLCENPQAQGDTCDVCGKRLSYSPPTTEQYPLLPDLEFTTVAGAANAGASGPPMPELELHRAAPVAVEVEAIPGMEATPVVGAGEAAPAPRQDVLEDLEQTRWATPGPKTELSERVTCRYCGREQRRQNRLCEGCANALSRVAPVPSAKAVEERRIRCPSCGFESAPSSACPACGFFLRDPDA